jgi:hypothetical protein
MNTQLTVVLTGLAAIVIISWAMVWNAHEQLDWSRAFIDHGKCDIISIDPIKTRCYVP